VSGRQKQHHCTRVAVSAGITSVVLGGCRGAQSVLEPHGPIAESLAASWWIMLAGAAVILVLVMSLLLYAALRSPDHRRSINDLFLIIAGGVVLPIVTLTALLIYATRLMDSVHAVPTDALRIEVIGHQWWWEIRYPGYPNAVTANEVHIPIERDVLIELISADVIHSFWIPNLAGKIDVLPEQRNRLLLSTDRVGVYRGQCAEFCGAQHARMGLMVVAQTAADFDAWVTRQQEPAAEPPPALSRGQRAFLQSDCVACHTIRGTPSQGRGAPDLTHVGTRRTLAALTLENTPTNLAAWIADSEAFKPRSGMPPHPGLDKDTLTAIAAYLYGLK
jgi:cytochrome c oxidase subunit II